jgi:hypothetical protein
MLEVWNGGTIETFDGTRFDATFENEFLGTFFSRKDAEIAIDNCKARKAIERLREQHIAEEAEADAEDDETPPTYRGLGQVLAGQGAIAFPARC